MDLSELDADQEFFNPLQGLLDQCRGAKVLSRHVTFISQVICLLTWNPRKLARRLEDLTQESSALKSHLIPQLRAMNDVVPELVNFGFSVSYHIFAMLLTNNIPSWRSE